MANSRKDKKSVGILKWIVPGIALMAYLGVTLLGYNDTMQVSSRVKAIDKVTKQAIIVSSYYEGVFDTKIDIAQAVAAYCMEDEDIFDQKNVDYLTSLQSSLGLHEAYIIKPEGDAICLDGEVHKGLFADAAYEGILGDTDVMMTKEKEDGGAYVLIAAPIRTEYEKKGTVVFEFESDKISEIIDTPNYNYSLIFNDGITVDHLETGSDFFEVGANLFDKLSAGRFILNNAEAMKKNMSVGKSGYVETVIPGSENKILVYQPLKKYPCTVVIAVNSLAIDRSAYDENLETQNIIMKILVSVGIFLGLIILIYVVSRVASTKENRELQNKAETDLLTDLYNKMSTERKIREYLDGEGKSKTNMMCVLDIDNFKKINDTMGHAFGDEVLSTLGKRLKSEFRVTDIIGRMGGDEFVIFLKDVKDDTIISREANRVEEFFKNFQVGQYTKYSATASIGVAIYPKDALDYDALYKASDAALYTSKKRGKNQLSFFGEGVIEKDEDEDDDE